MWLILVKWWHLPEALNLQTTISLFFNEIWQKSIKIFHIINHTKGNIQDYLNKRIDNNIQWIYENVVSVNN